MDKVRSIDDEEDTKVGWVPRPKICLLWYILPIRIAQWQLC